MRIWIDDLRPMPDGYDIHIKSVHRAIDYIKKHYTEIEHISLDHDAGDYELFGGDYIEILNWLEEFTEGGSVPFTFAIHSGNPVGCQHMWQIITHRGWTLVPAWDEVW